MFVPNHPLRLHPATALQWRLLVRTMRTAGLVSLACVTSIAADEIISARASGFERGGATSVADGTNHWTLGLHSSNAPALPFNQAAIKQGTAPALEGPDPIMPYFTVRFALPVPPENDTNLTGVLVGLDANVLAHHHSPGFEVLPNGDALAVWFSATEARGASENTNTTGFVQARLRYGSEQWDLPELFFDFEHCNDQSGLLWNDGGTLRFFGGGRGMTPMLPFKMATSTNNGATWALSLPQLDKPAEDFTPPPINSAFRGADGAIYVAMDAGKDESFLWRSADSGTHWHQLEGRTAARRSPIVPQGEPGNLLSIGGENNAVNGWSPEHRSTNYGASWSESKASPFPPFGGDQRPSLLRLANGHLFYAGDSYLGQSGKSPEGWELGQGTFVAISTNNGVDWHFKNLPVELPHNADRHFGTLGYATARQAPNGTIHLLTTLTQPCLHYEFNERWVFSGVGDTLPETGGGRIQSYREDYPSGKLRSLWSARICPNGRYLLYGLETDYYENGRKQHEVAYVNGRKSGEENFWSPDEKKIWSWRFDVNKDTGVWTQYWPNGREKIQSTWNTQPTARDLPRSFFGLVADGPVFHWDENGVPLHAYNFTNGVLAGALPLQKGGEK